MSTDEHWLVAGDCLPHQVIDILLSLECTLIASECMLIGSLIR